MTNVLTLRQPGVSKDHGLDRNPGMEFTPGLFAGLRINRSAVERRAATIAKRRSIKKDHQTAWLLKALTCIDLTPVTSKSRRFARCVLSYWHRGRKLLTVTLHRGRTCATTTGCIVKTALLRPATRGLPTPLNGQDPNPTQKR